MLEIIRKMLPTSNDHDKKEMISIDEIASLVKSSKDALLAFEDAYNIKAINQEDQNLFRKNKGNFNPKKAEIKKSSEEIINLIVEELLDQTLLYDSEQNSFTRLPKEGASKRFDRSDILSIPEADRPFFTGYYAKRDIEEERPSSLMLFYYKKYMETGDIQFYHRFRQGLDILDLDFLSYQMLSMNENSMMNYLPKIKGAVSRHGFFKIPATKIIKVPMSFLQTIRCHGYEALNPVTQEIINRYIFKACELDVNKSYFVKTGTFSSKFFFRNAKVEKGDEVKELGLYLYFIQSQAQQMASPLNNKSIYGVSTTNDFVVREFIEDPENNVTIYSGLPLRTEYRIFVDFDEKEVLHIHPYWDPEYVKKSFSDRKKESVHDMHDYVIFQAEEDRLMNTFQQNKDLVVQKIAELLQEEIPLAGQWSIDIMQNGSSDFYLIDMAKAENSTFSNYIPKEKLKASPENWIPSLNGR